MGLQRRLRRELQVEPLIICLVQPAPAGTPAYKGRADSEPDSRPAPRGRREAPRGNRGEQGGSSRPAPVPAAANAVAPAGGTSARPAVTKTTEEPEPSGRTRRRRSAALAG